MQMLLAALSRRMSCSRARRVITKARWPSDVGRHPDEPAGDLADERVGRGEDPEVRARRTAARSRAAGPRRPRCRRRTRPGGARTASETGSMTLTNRAPAAWASRPISAIGSSRPRKFGWAGDHAGDRASPSASSRSSAARSVVPAASPVRDERDRRRARARRRSRSRASGGSAGWTAATDEDPLAAGRPAGHQARPRRSPRRRRSARR